jgi:citrate synthase
MPENRVLSAHEAAQALNISVATLYAYVSRGLIRSEAAGKGQRQHYYRRDDVERLRAQQDRRRNPDRAAEQALSWGMPVLESALTHIADGRLAYRGQDAAALAEQGLFEHVAGLLWLGDEAPSMAWAIAAAIEAGYAAFDPWRSWAAGLARATPVERFQVVLPLAARQDAAAFDLRPGAVALAGARILGLLCAAATYPAAPAGGRLAGRLAQGWGVRNEAGTRLIEAALILCADHELNTSAFTARCAASVRATPYQVVIAALAALQGLRHGGQSERAEALFDEAGQPARVRAAIAAWLRRGEPLPGFGHPLYPDGDPRALVLLRLAQAAAPRSRELALARALIAEAEAVTGQRPTIDLALVAAARALRLPQGSALALFALGRTAGWVAHALEQYQIEAMIRPRAKYVGP